MTIPTDATLPDLAPSAIRYDRDRVWDTAIGADSTLTAETAAGHSISDGSYLGEPPEIPDIPNRAVLIGTFTGWKSVLTASWRAIYTEVTIQVSHVFEDVQGRATAASSITIIFAGGTVKTADGQTISFMTNARSQVIEPKKTYLLVLEHRTAGDFYILGTDFELSDGIVRADNSRDRIRYEQGRSSLVGLTVDELVRLLDEKFSTPR